MNHTPRSPHPRAARATGGAVLIAFLCGVGFLTWKAHLQDASNALYTREGAEAMVLALDGETRSWDRARDAYRKAAAHSITDPYPVFCIAMVDRLEALRADSKGAAQPADEKGPEVWADFRPAHVYLARGELASAREALVKIGPNLDPSAHKRLGYHLRLLTELESAALLKTPHPGSQQ